MNTEKIVNEKRQPALKVAEVSGSALIAQFMNCTTVDKNWPYRVNDNLWKLEGLKYDKSWDWLMPVIEKIEKLEVKGYEEDKEFIQQFTVEISNEQCVIHRDFAPQYWGTETDFLELYDCNNMSKIESTFTAIVKFIEWFNTI